MINSMKVYNVGPFPAISAIWEQPGIGRILDSVLKWGPKQCKLSPASKLKAIVINILAGRTPLVSYKNLRATGYLSFWVPFRLQS